MTIAWVLGGGGLLGSALSRSLHHQDIRLFVPVRSFSWNIEIELADQLAEAVGQFSKQVTDRWEIYWAAGIGRMGSSTESMAAETRALTLLLQLLSSDAVMMAAFGTITLASSAGGIYAGSSDEVVTENSAPAPTTEYADEKIKQECLLRSFVRASDRVHALIARISTLYGAGQARGKPQGLLGYLARHVVRNQPVEIYVPYDTIRDYIDADDAAASIVASARASDRISGVTVKIISSETPATIAEILSIFKRISRRPPRIVRTANKLSAVYSRRVQFKSVVPPIRTRSLAKQLPVGIAQLMAAERLAFMSARPRPSPSLLTLLSDPSKGELQEHESRLAIDRSALGSGE